MTVTAAPFTPHGRHPNLDRDVYAAAHAAAYGEPTHPGESIERYRHRARNQLTARVRELTDTDEAAFDLAMRATRAVIVDTLRDNAAAAHIAGDHTTAARLAGDADMWDAVDD